MLAYIHYCIYYSVSRRMDALSVCYLYCLPCRPVAKHGSCVLCFSRAPFVSLRACALTADVHIQTKQGPYTNFLSAPVSNHRRAQGQELPPQSVSIRSPPLPSPFPSLLACSCSALKNGSTPVPASAGSPSVRTRSPSSPVRSAMSRLRTAARNCGEATTCSSVSAVGGLGRSGGRCGKSDCASSGWDANNGRRFAGVSTSVSEISCWAVEAAARPAPALVPREVTMERMRASSSGVGWYSPGRCDLKAEWIGRDGGCRRRVCGCESVGRHLRGRCRGRRSRCRGCRSLVVGVVAGRVPDGDDAWVREEAVHVAHELFVPTPVGILVSRRVNQPVVIERVIQLVHLHPELWRIIMLCSTYGACRMVGATYEVPLV